MGILKRILINICNTIRIFITNLRRNFIRELLVGIGVVFGVTILIIATTFGDGFERLIKNSILGEIKYEQLKIKGDAKKDGTKTKITIEHINELKQIEGIVDVLPMTNISFPISAKMKIPMTKSASKLELIGNAVPPELANAHINENLRNKFPNGFHKTNGLTPVLFSNFVLEAIENFFEAENLPKLDLEHLLKNGYRFDLYMGKSLFRFSSAKSKIKLPDNSEIDSKIFDNAMNKVLNEEYNNQEKNSIGGNKNQPIYNPFESDNYKALINNDYIESCIFVGFAPLHITFTLSLPLDIIQAYKRELEGDKFQEGYDSAFINIKNTEYLDIVMQELLAFNEKNNFKIDEQYETLRGISKIVKNTITSLRALVIGLGILILFLSVISIFYSFMYSISRREKEIGLYRFFGATRGKVIALLVLESTFIGFLCALLAYLFSHWLITSFLPSSFDKIFENISADFLNLIFSTGNDFSKNITFSNIFRFDYARSQLFLWLGVLCSAIASFIPAVKGSYTSLFKTINS